MLMNQLLEQRRTDNGASKTKLRYSRPPGTKMHIEVPADYYCQLFNPAEANEQCLTACLIQRENRLGRLDEMEMPPGYEIVPGPTFDLLPFRSICNANGLQARVSENARGGDYILSFHMSGVEAGLVVREISTSPQKLRIVGQAILGDHTRVCAGGTSCSCSLDPAMHPEKQTQIIVHFDPEDLLLFVCHNFAKSEERTLPLTLWKDVKAGQNIRPYCFTDVGDFLDDEKLQPLRMITAVVQIQNDLSSFATFKEHAEQDGISGGHTAQLKALSDLVQHIETLNRG